MKNDLQFRDRVSVMKDGKPHGGFVLEIARSGLSSPLSDQPPPILGVRLWLDGEPQPEHAMRQLTELL